MLLPSEVEAFKERAKAELRGEDGEIEFPYMEFRVRVSCEKGIPRKIRVEAGGKTIYRKV